MADPLKRFGPRRRYVPAHAAPRIIFFDGSVPHKLPPPPGPHDQIDATRLALRLAGIGRALSDLPAQAQRYVRWKARQQRNARFPSPLWGSEGRARQAARPGKLRGGGNLSAREAKSVEEAARAADAGIALLGQPLDVVVLGMGADGHTASFFPDASNLDELLDPAQTRRVMPVETAAGGEPRLTVTLPLIAGARFLALHIEGREKRAVLDKALSDARPTQLIRRVLDAAASKPQIYWTA